jgi:uncharacterized FlaG/YvyC family protein
MHMSILTTTALGKMAEPAMQIPRPAPSPQIPAVVEPLAARPVSTGSETRLAQNNHLQELEAELAAANSKLAGDGHEVRFEYDRNASQLIVRLVDVTTEKVLRQYPSEEALRVARLVKSGKPLINMQA